MGNESFVQIIWHALHVVTYYTMVISRLSFRKVCNQFLIQLFCKQVSKPIISLL